DQTLFAGSLVAARFHKLPEPPRPGADNSALEIRVDLARGVEGGVSAMHRPGAHFVFADGEKRLQAEQPVARVNQPVESRLGDAGAGEILPPLFPRQLAEL